MKPSRSEFLPIRGLRYHLRQWGSEGAPRLILLHGWMDVSASFQFVVDCLRQDWHVIAPDWRGFGLSQAGPGDTYWFPDYTADLEAILDHLDREIGGTPVRLAGHSMGGNIAMNYAGVRPQRVAAVVNLEGFGLPATSPAQAPARQALWLDQLRCPPQMTSYPTREAVIARLKKTNPRLTAERAGFLSNQWARENEEGQWQILGDARHKAVSPLLYQLPETEVIWRNIAAPVLWVEGEDTRMLRALGQATGVREETRRRTAWLRDCRCERIADAGHMLHHDQPEEVAALIEQFFTA